MVDSVRADYNPDVLSCLANLSNDEVFTPPAIVNAMLDMLPQGLFSNPDTTFLDPVTKSGVFLREIAKRLVEGLSDKIPDLQERVDHIFHKQLYGIAITELTSLLARRSVYCSKYPNGKYSISQFTDAEGHIRFKKIQHTWSEEKCVFCGAPKSEYDRDETLESHAYEFIHASMPEGFFDMKFDVIIGNPPYQLSDGGNGVSAMPIFQHFIEQSMKLRPRYLSMIVPARWYAGGKGLNEFREVMLNDCHIRKIFDYESSRDCFAGVNIAGGVCYFLWDRDNEGLCEINNSINGKFIPMERKLNEFPILIRSNLAISIVHKILKSCIDVHSNHACPRNPFGFSTNYRGRTKRISGDIEILSSAGFQYVQRSEIKKTLTSSIVIKFSSAALFQVMENWT